MNKASEILRNLTGEELEAKLNSYGGVKWINTSEHAELTRRQWEARQDNG